MIRILKSGRAKAGHEFEYNLAWKHRQIASKWMRKTHRMFFGKKYNQAFSMWSRALDRIHIHGEDVILDGSTPSHIGDK